MSRSSGSQLVLITLAAGQLLMTLQNTMTNVGASLGTGALP